MLLHFCTVISCPTCGRVTTFNIRTLAWAGPFYHVAYACTECGNHGDQWVDQKTYDLMERRKTQTEEET